MLLTRGILVGSLVFPAFATTTAATTSSTRGCWLFGSFRPRIFPAKNLGVTFLKLHSFSTNTTRTATMSQDDDNNNNKKPLIIYALPGSQYVFKVLAPLQGYQIDHFVHFVPFSNEKERQKVLPSGGTLVPELQHGLPGHPDTKIVTDSEAILEYLCQQGILPDLYPTPETHALSKRISDGTIAAMVWYYNWVDWDGHARSLRHSIGTSPSVPWFVPWFVLDYLMRPTCQKHRKLVQSVLPQAQLDNEPSMRALLKDELVYLNGLFLSENQPYLIPSAKEPTAADFSLLALMERLVGGTVEPVSSDYATPPSIPSIRTENEESLARLWNWHDRMRTQYAVQFQGRRAPKEMLVSNNSK